MIITLVFVIEQILTEVKELQEEEEEEEAKKENAPDNSPMFMIDRLIEFTA
jgi:hypothetical protein